MPDRLHPDAGGVTWNPFRNRASGLRGESRARAAQQLNLWNGSTPRQQRISGRAGARRQFFTQAAVWSHDRLIKEDRYDDNRIRHARLRIGNSVIMLNESSEGYPANISQMHIYVNDADEAYARALHLGAISLMRPNVRPHGDRMAGIKDPCGNVWWIAARQT